MDQMPPALPHGQLEEVFPDVFSITGTMKTVLMNAEWQFSRSMAVVRDGNALTLINAVRLDDPSWRNSTRSAASRNDQDRLNARQGHAFYQARYGAKLWALPGMVHDHGLVADHDLSPGGAMPFAGCSAFVFRTTKQPECILRIDRAGGNPGFLQLAAELG